MGNKLYIGNLPCAVRDENLQQSFGSFGAVTSAKVRMEWNGMEWNARRVAPKALVSSRWTAVPKLRPRSVA